MESHPKCEKDSSLLSDIPLSILGKTKTANLKVATALVLGDTQGGDKICCRSATHLELVNRICRKCTIPGKQCGNLEFQCQKVSMNKIKKLVANEDSDCLARHNQHCVNSIWYELHHGGCKFGVFSAANPTEWLHALDNGLIEHCLHKLCSKTPTNNERVAVDSIVKNFANLPRQRLMSSNSNSLFPGLSWKNGISRLTDITADCKVGMLLTVVVVSLTAEEKIV